MPLIFSYGTLKKGGVNEQNVKRGTGAMMSFVGEGLLVERYPLHVIGEYNAAVLLDQPGAGKRVYGHIFEIDEATLAKMDHMECCPILYNRKLLKVEVLRYSEDSSIQDGPKHVDCNVYVSDAGVFKPEFLQGEIHNCYPADAASECDVSGLSQEESFNKFVVPMLNDGTLNRAQFVDGTLSWKE